MNALLRVYLDRAEIGLDGYPLAWHKSTAVGRYEAGHPLSNPAIKDLVRMQAGHRCVRCGHPYRKGEHGNGEWSPCDEQCMHGEPVRFVVAGAAVGYIEAQWRILTVHHLNGIKYDCRWWNLAALCQRCHLSIQTRVVMDRPWDKPHSDWFKPYAAGYYAWADHGLELTREETLARIDEFLGPHLLQHTLEGLV